MSEKVDWEQVRASEKEDWEQVRELEIRLQLGQPMELTGTVSDLLRRTARQVALSPEEAERGLRSPSDAAALVAKIRRRIQEGSVRLGQAMLDAASRKAMGDDRGARKLLKRALEAEAVPYYREGYEALLHSLEAPKN
jgi:DUSAM domain-containing protein